MNLNLLSSQEIKRIVVAMHEQGKTHEEIAKMVGKSRDAISGICTRLGLTRGRGGNPRGWIARKVRLANPEPVLLGPVGTFPDGQVCRWIAGDPDAQFQCCAQPGFPYCDHHRAKAYSQRKVQS